MRLITWIKNRLYGNVKVRIADVVVVLNKLDANGDGYITIPEVVKAVKGIDDFLKE